MREFRCPFSALFAATGMYQESQTGESEETQGEKAPEPSSQDTGSAKVEKEEKKRRLIWANW